jgi:hypothetical protein
MRLLSATLVIALSASHTGCTAVRLSQRTVNQASTLSDLQFQQVMNNLALFAENPAALPWHISLREGTTQITDSLSGGAAVDLGPPSNTLPQRFGSRTVVAQWGMSPIIDPLELRLLRLAYQRAHGSSRMLDADFATELAHELKNQLPQNADLRDESDLFFEYQSRGHRNFAEFDSGSITSNDDAFCTDPTAPLGHPPQSPLARDVCRRIEILQRDLARIQPGWFHVGRKCDVPANACYVGRYKDRCTWVGPEGREALTEFTLTILKFSSLIKETQTLINPGSVKFSPGDR